MQLYFIIIDISIFNFFNSFLTVFLSIMSDICVVEKISILSTRDCGFTFESVVMKLSFVFRGPEIAQIWT